MPCTTKAARAGASPRMLAPSCWPPGATHLPRCFRCRRCLAAAALGLGLLLRFLLSALLDLRQEEGGVHAELMLWPLELGGNKG